MSQRQRHARMEIGSFFSLLLTLDFWKRLDVSTVPGCHTSRLKDNSKQAADTQQLDPDQPR